MLDFSTNFVCATHERATFNKHVPAPVFRRSFDLDAMPEQLVPAGRGCGSHNHHFLGDYKQWYIRQVAGIVVNPAQNDPNNVVIRPHFIKSLDYASAYHILPGGKIEVKWTRIDENTVNVYFKHVKGVKAHLSLTPDCIVTDGYRRSDGKYPTNGEYNVTVKTI